jgi:hypothetical protein
MRAIIAAVVIFPAIAFSETTKIEVGATWADTAKKLERIGAVDITSGMEVVGPKGEWPLKGIYWVARDYDAVLEFSTKKAGIAAICFWTKADFSGSKSGREDHRRQVRSVTFDSETKLIQIDKARKNK